METLTIKQLKEAIDKLDDNKQVKVWIEEDGVSVLSPIIGIDDGLTCVTLEHNA